MPVTDESTTPTAPTTGSSADDTPVDASAEMSAVPPEPGEREDAQAPDQATEVSEPDVAEPDVAEPDLAAPGAESASVDAPPAQPPAVEQRPEEPAAAPAPASPVPSPAIFAKRHVQPDHHAEFGRVAEDGVVYVKDGGTERPVGSYPGASPREALAYFGRKYDELLAAADLLLQRVTQTDISAKDAQEGYAKLAEQCQEPNAVGDLAALRDKIAQIAASVEDRRAADAEHRAAAREEARVQRETLVAEAERIAAQPEGSIQWKNSGARMRELLDEWKAHQRSGPRLDRSTETALWQRFSAARNGFDRARRVHFAQLDTQQASARAAKEKLVAEAERLSTSKDWTPTAGAFKRLMDDWRRAGRAGRQDDDALWERFKAAQDAFFAAKDAVVAKEEEEFRGNLAVKEKLLAEAEQILPVTDLDAAKTALRSIQDRWDRAGKVPRADLERTEKAMRRIEQAVRDVEDRRWASSNPEAAARAQSLADQLESAIQPYREALAKAEASGDARKVEDARAALESREALLAQARRGVDEFGS